VFRQNDQIGGKYRLRKRLAVGGMGEVWLAQNLATRGQVALKLLCRGTDSELEEETAQRFRNEARLSVSLAHRNIVKVYDLIEDPDGTLGLVMELLRGESVAAKLVRSGPMANVKAVAIMAPILNALGHAHDRGIVHRDVTPSNVFLAIDPDGHVTPKLVDFGLAKPIGSGQTAAFPAVQTLDGRVLGTPMYMAPERIRGSDVVDPRSDVFAVSVVLYEMMTGTSPFQATTPSASLAAVLERQVDPDPRIDPRVWLEIRRGMSKQLYERHATAREFGDALVSAVGGTEATLQSSLVSEPAPGWNDAADADARSTHPPPLDRRPLGEQHRKPVPRGVWIAAVGILGALALALLGLRAATTRTPAAVTLDKASVAPTATPALPPPAVPTPPAPPPPAPTATVRPAPPSLASTHSKHPAAEPPHAKPVATNPGF
jgi:serine/threonine-protein kinase